MTTTPTPAYTALYWIYWQCWDSCQPGPGPHQCHTIRTYPVTRVTAKRIYFEFKGFGYFVARADIEPTGSTWHTVSRTELHLEPPDGELTRLNRQSIPSTPTVAELRRAAAALHPDRGGDPTQFRLAHERYLAAKARTDA